MAKLTELQVLRLRKYRSQGASIKSLAEKFGISESNVCNVANGLTWSHV